MNVESTAVSAELINLLIKSTSVNTNLISDGYHTFGELYEHRITLFIAFCKVLDDIGGYNVWRSKRHADNTSWDGWFIMGIGIATGHQITYHLPMSKWEETEFAVIRDRAPEWDGHSSNDVLERLKAL